MAIEKTKVKQPSKKNKTSFKKGHKGHTGGGRPKLTAAQKELSLKTRTDFKNIINKYLMLNLPQIRELLHDEELPVLDMMVLKNLELTYKMGSPNNIDWHIDHVVGKPKVESTLHLQGNLAPVSVDPKKMTKKQLEDMKKLMIEIGKKGA